MNFKKTLFYLSVFCISTALAEYRHIPDRSKMFPEERHSNSFRFIRNLDGDNSNSHNESSSQIDPVTVRLQGNTELGYYYVTLFFGSPIQKQTLIVDTGSATTTIPCTECGNDCGKNHFDQPFNHKNSKSFEEFKCGESFGDYSCYDCSNKCPFTVSYVEGSSYSGHFNKDYVVFGNEIEDNFHVFSQPKSDNSTGTNTDSNKADDQTRQYVNDIVEKRKIFMTFGCTNRETKLFYEQEADGILGLGVHTNTQSSPPNLPDSLRMHKSEASAAFSLCLAQDGGYFTVGGHNGAYHASNEKIQYIRYSDAFSQYKVVLNKIEVGGKDINVKIADLNSGEGAFFDSGTTLTHVPSKTYTGIRTYLRNYCESDDMFCGKGAETSSGSFCWTYKPQDFASLDDFYATFPIMKFYFGRDDLAEYEWKPEDYLYEKDDNLKTYCLGLSRYERESILGGTFMKNHDILFDKENKRIGFIRANCNGVQEVTAPVFIENNRSAEVTEESRDPSQHGGLGLESHPKDLTEANTLKAAIVMCLIGAAASVVVGLGIFVYRICRKKTPYQQMRNNIRIEIPSAGLSVHRLDSSGVETPKLGDQPPQDNKAGAIAETADVEEQSSPEIHIEV